MIRISRATFSPDTYEDVRAALDASRAKLESAIAPLRGFIHCWSAIDRTTHTMVNVSVWQTVEDAKQLDQLPAMLAFAGELVGLGVSFERPITNSDVLWNF